jgi:predicted anti-sigma-YlaC factor YlaD
VSFPATDCASARESVSAQLDGELGERELDRLETHLRVCPACTAWADEVRDVTRQLREARFEKPLEPFIRPRLRRSWRVASAVAVASAAAVVATMFFASGRQSTSIGSLAAGPPSSDTTFDVTAGVIYPPHPALGSVTLGVSSPHVAPRPVRAL